MTTAKALPLFGTTGDLAQRMLLPSLHGRQADELGVSPQRMIRINADTGKLAAFVDDLEDWEPAAAPRAPAGTGYELFAFMRSGADSTERAASAFQAEMELAA